MKKDKIIMMFFVFIFLLIAGSTAQAETVEGRIQGFTCVTEEKLCFVDKYDPRLALESVFVLAGKNNTYHHVQIADSSILKRNVLKKTRITGDPIPTYKTIKAEKVEVYKEGKWREVWSLEAHDWEKKEWEEMQSF